MPPLTSQFSSPYACLGITPSATEDEIRTAYKTRAVQLHPDKVPESHRQSSTAQFQELQAAYEICLRNISGARNTQHEDDWDSEHADEDEEWTQDDYYEYTYATSAAGGVLIKESKAEKARREWLAWAAANEHLFCYMSDDGTIDSRQRRLGGYRLDGHVRMEDFDNYNSPQFQNVSAKQRLDSYNRQVAARMKRDEEMIASGKLDLEDEHVRWQYEKNLQRLRRRGKVLEEEAKVEQRLREQGRGSGRKKFSHFQMVGGVPVREIKDSVEYVSPVRRIRSDQARVEAVPEHWYDDFEEDGAVPAE